VHVLSNMTSNSTDLAARALQLSPATCPQSSLLREGGATCAWLRAVWRTRRTHYAIFCCFVGGYQVKAKSS
jgi:hypothetical protein